MDPGDIIQDLRTEDIDPTVAIILRIVTEIDLLGMTIGTESDLVVETGSAIIVEMISTTMIDIVVGRENVQGETLSVRENENVVQTILNPVAG
jgi:hypothetical protein